MILRGQRLCARAACDCLTSWLCSELPAPAHAGLRFRITASLRRAPRGGPRWAALPAALTVCALPQEQAQLYLRSAAVSPATFQQPGRQVKLWVKMVTPLIKNFF